MESGFVSTIDRMGDSKQVSVFEQGMESFHRELLRKPGLSPEDGLKTLVEFGREIRQRSPPNVYRGGNHRTIRDSVLSSKPELDTELREPWSYQYQVALEQCGVVFSDSEFDPEDGELDSSEEQSGASDISESDDERHSVMNAYAAEFEPPGKRQCRTDVRESVPLVRHEWENSQEGEILSSSSMRCSPLECHEQSLSGTLGSQDTVSLPASVGD